VPRTLFCQAGRGKTADRPAPPAQDPPTSLNAVSALTRFPARSTCSQVPPTAVTSGSEAGHSATGTGHSAAPAGSVAPVSPVGDSVPGRKDCNGGSHSRQAGKAHGGFTATETLRRQSGHPPAWSAGESQHPGKGNYQGRREGVLRSYGGPEMRAGFVQESVLRRRCDAGGPC